MYYGLLEYGLPCFEIRRISVEKDINRFHNPCIETILPDFLEYVCPHSFKSKQDEPMEDLLLW